MAVSLNSTRFAWLAAAVKGQRDRIADLIARMTGLTSSASVGNMKPTIFRKFMGMLEQVADAHAEEERLLSRIENLEAIHKGRRKKRLLHRAEPLSEQAPLILLAEPVPPKSADELQLLLALWYYVSGQGSNAKKTRLNVG